MTKVDIISGFLGAGKTTLIKKLLKEVYVNQQVVLIENEFGEIGIDGGFLKEAGINITIQKYLTPNGTDINKKGITPDIIVKLTEEDVKNKNDLQLKKAVEVLSKMTNGQSIAVQ